MKKINWGIFITISFCISINACGQANKPIINKPVALGSIYQLPKLDYKTAVPNTTPVLTKNILNNYIAIIEWHFEMRFTPNEREQYEAIVVDLWNNDPTGKERTNMQEASVYVEELRKKNWYDLFSEQSSRRNNDIMDCGMEGLLSNWEPTSLRGKIKKGAKEGNQELIFLWNKITVYEQPVADGKVFVSNFTQRYIDAAAEWIAYKINVVANKELLVLDETKRQQMKKMILEAWNKEQAGKKNTYEYGNVEAMLSEASTYWNTHRLTRTYSFDNLITNYNKLATMVEWGKQALFYFPGLKPYVEQRIKELNEYAAKMSDAEWQMEFKRLNMQADMNKLAFQEMKNQQVRSHVLSLNIIEGYNKWEVKETRIY